MKKKQEVMKYYSPEFKETLINYALNNGWKRDAEFFNKFFIFVHYSEEQQLLIPMSAEFDDYSARISDALEVISRTEERPISNIINNILG